MKLSSVTFIHSVSLPGLGMRQYATEPGFTYNEELGMVEFDDLLIPLTNIKHMTKGVEVGLNMACVSPVVDIAAFVAEEPGVDPNYCKKCEMLFKNIGVHRRHKHPGDK